MTRIHTAGTWDGQHLTLEGGALSGVPAGQRVEVTVELPAAEADDAWLTRYFASLPAAGVDLTPPDDPEGEDAPRERFPEP